ncbi:MAG: hypothetical protein U0935_03190 [Pirellulales bacterium]
MPTSLLHPAETPVQPCPAPRKRALIVDESRECRDVLRAALERRGWEIWDAPGAEQGLDLARRCHPDVIVLDAETAPRDAEEQQVACAAAYEKSTPSLVILGDWQAARASHVRSQVVEKPYHFAPLVGLIEELMQGRRAA